METGFAGQPPRPGGVKVDVPLIEIRALPQHRSRDVQRVLRRLTADVAAAIGAREEAVWVTWSTIDGGYAVGDDVRTAQPEASHAPIAHVYARRTAAELDAISAAVETALTEELKLAAGNVFVTVQPVYAVDPEVARLSG